jgi:hypothetical protein
MPESNGKGVSCFYRLWQRFKNKMIQEVPEDYGWCEFDCKKLQCSMSDWRNCEDRLRSKVLRSGTNLKWV